MNETKLRTANTGLGVSKKKPSLTSKGSVNSTSSASDESNTSSPLPSPTEFDSFPTNCPLDLSQKSSRAKLMPNNNAKPSLKCEPEDFDESASSQTSLSQINPALIAAASVLIQNPAKTQPGLNSFGNLNLFKFPNFYLNYLNTLNESKLPQGMLSFSMQNKTPSLVNTSNIPFGDFNMNLLNYLKNSPFDKDLLMNTLSLNPFQSLSSSSSTSSSVSSASPTFQAQQPDAYSGILSNLQMNTSNQKQSTSIENEVDILQTKVNKPRGRQPKQKQPVELLSSDNKTDESEQEVYTSYNENDEREPMNKRAKIETDPSGLVDLSAAGVKPGRRGSKQGSIVRAKSQDESDPLSSPGSLKPVIDPTTIKPELLIHGGYGVKNPEYEALNNDINLFECKYLFYLKLTKNFKN